MTNKVALLQHLIWEEVILRRESNIHAFMKGLSHLKLLELMQKYPEILRPLFVADSAKSQVTTESFLKLMGSLRPREEKQQKAFDYFQDFIIYLGGWFAYQLTY